MELQHSYAAARKLRRSLRVAFFLARKGLTSKRKLIMEAYTKALRKYTYLVMLHKVSCRSTARPPPAGHSFRVWERYEHFSIGNCRQSPSYCFHPDDDSIDEELDHEVSGPVFSTLEMEDYSLGCIGDVNISGAGADDDELIAEEIDDRAEEFIKRFYEELSAQSDNYDEL